MAACELSLLLAKKFLLFNVTISECEACCSVRSSEQRCEFLKLLAEVSVALLVFALGWTGNFGNLHITQLYAFGQFSYEQNVQFHLLVTWFLVSDCTCTLESATSSLAFDVR